MLHYQRCLSVAGVAVGIAWNIGAVAPAPADENEPSAVITAEQPDSKPHGKDQSSSLHSHPNAPKVAMPAAYLKAVRNAETATPQHISRGLTAILDGSPQLIWRQNQSRPEVLVATWTSEASYYPKPGSTFTETYEVWITAAPQLKQFCQRHLASGSKTPLSRRLEQLLGLPPDSGHKFVVELWVSPQDLFRPSADAEVTDHESELQFPDVPGVFSVSETYQQWYQQTKSRRYKPKAGPPYPWTRLGYTYDWGNPETRVGLSEFVIRKNATLTVKSVTTTEQYAAESP